MTTLLNSESSLLEKMEVRVRTRKNANGSTNVNLCKLPFSTNFSRRVKLVAGSLALFCDRSVNIFSLLIFILYLFQVFNYLTTFQFTQLTQLKQWSLLHANQPVVPQATPVPGFERLMLLSQNVDQDISTSMKPRKASKMIS